MLYFITTGKEAIYKHQLNYIIQSKVINNEAINLGRHYPRMEQVLKHTFSQAYLTRKALLFFSSSRSFKPVIQFLSYEVSCTTKNKMPKRKQQVKKRTKPPKTRPNQTKKRHFLGKSWECLCQHLCAVQGQKTIYVPMKLKY